MAASGVKDGQQLLDLIDAGTGALGRKDRNTAAQKYAQAAEGLLKPSSAARALLAGAPKIERTDLLVKTIAASKGMQCDNVDRTVAMVDLWLQANRDKA